MSKTIFEMEVEETSANALGMAVHSVSGSFGSYVTQVCVRCRIEVK